MMSDTMINGASPQISLCRLCCCKMYAGESMLLIDTTKLQAWLRWHNAIELEFLPGHSNEFCHFCLYKVDMFLRGAWKNEKTLRGNCAKVARMTSLDRSTSGWSFCRACLGAVHNPDTCTTIEKYGIAEINTLVAPLGFKITFLPDYPNFLCSLCISNVHKFMNSFLLNKSQLTPLLYNFWCRLKKVPVPSIESFTSGDNLPNLPDIHDPAVSIVEVLFSNISLEKLERWAHMGGFQIPRPTSPPQFMLDSINNHFFHQHEPKIFPLRVTPAPPPVAIMPSLEDLQEQAKQHQLNQYLSQQAHNMFHPNLANNLAVQMAMVQQQQQAINPFLNPFGLNPLNPYNMGAAFGHQLMSPPPPNLFVKRMAEQPKMEGPPAPKRTRRSRKPKAAPTKILTGTPEQRNVNRPDQFHLNGSRGLISFDTTPRTPEEVPFQAPPTLPLYKFYQDGSPPATISPAPLPSFKNAFPIVAKTEVPPSQKTPSPPPQGIAPSSEDQNAKITSTSAPKTPTDDGPKLGDTCLTSKVPSRTTSPSQDGEQKVPTIKIRLNDLYLDKKISPARGSVIRLPEIVQRSNSPKQSKAQEKITAYKGEEEDQKVVGGEPDSLSLKSLLANSPPPPVPIAEAEEPVPKVDDNSNFTELHGQSEMHVK